MSRSAQHFGVRSCVVIQSEPDALDGYSGALAKFLSSSFLPDAWKIQFISNKSHGPRPNPKRRVWMPEICASLKALGPNDIAVVDASNEDQLYDLFHLL